MKIVNIMHNDENHKNHENLGNHGKSCVAIWCPSNPWPLAWASGPATAFSQKTCKRKDVSPFFHCTQLAMAHCRELAWCCELAWLIVASSHGSKSLIPRNWGRIIPPHPLGCIGPLSWRPPAEPLAALASTPLSLRTASEGVAKRKQFS